MAEVSEELGGSNATVKGGVASRRRRLHDVRWEDRVLVENQDNFVCVEPVWPRVDIDGAQGLPKFSQKSHRSRQLQKGVGSGDEKERMSNRTGKECGRDREREFPVAYFSSLGAMLLDGTYKKYSV